MTDKELPKSKQYAIRAFEKDLVTALDNIAHWTRERNEAMLRIRQLMGEKAPPKTTRPWERIRDRATEKDKPLTWDEAYEACAILEQVGMKLEWKADLRRSVALAKELKIVNELVGLAEWPDDLFVENKDLS